MDRLDPSQQAFGKDGSPRADSLEQAFAFHQDKLLGMLYYLLGNREDARDALQEAFVKCWRCRERLPEVANLRAWVFRIALNVGRDMRGTAWRRRRRPLPEDDGAAPVASGNAPEVELARREQLQMVEKGLLALRFEEREVFLLRQNGEMTYEEIAQAIHIPVGTVKTRMRLALERLRQSLGPEKEPNAPGVAEGEKGGA